MKSYVRRAIEHAALVSLSLAPLASGASVSGCGGSSSDDASDAAAPADASLDATKGTMVPTGDGAASADDASTGGDDAEAMTEEDASIPPPVVNMTCGALVPVARDAGGVITCGQGFPITATAPGCMSDGGDIALATCAALCPPGGEDGGAAPIFCYLYGASDGTPASTGDGGGLVIECTYQNCASGRRPEGFAPTSRDYARAGDATARFLATATTLEAASVFAFRTMARELSSLGAPRRLTRRARRSAREEVQHTRSMRTLARQADAAIPEIAVPGATPRSIEAMAIENAVEGCVRETFGAAVAMHQAASASDPETRRRMRVIAKDEAEHAQLSWRVARFFDHHLDTDARARVREKRDLAVIELRSQITVAPEATVAREMGLPSPREAGAILATLDASLWR